MKKVKGWAKHLPHWLWYVVGAGIAAILAYRGWQAVSGAAGAAATSSDASLAAAQLGAGDGGGGASLPPAGAIATPTSGGSSNDSTASLISAVEEQTAAISGLAAQLASGQASGPGAGSGSGAAGAPAPIVQATQTGTIVANSPAALAGQLASAQRVAASGASSPQAYDAALQAGKGLPAQDVSVPSMPVANDGGGPLYTTAFGRGTATDPLDFSALSSAAIGGDPAAQATLRAQGYKLIKNPATGQNAVVPA